MLITRHFEIAMRPFEYRRLAIKLTITASLVSVSLFHNRCQMNPFEKVRVKSKVSLSKFFRPLSMIGFIYSIRKHAVYIIGVGNTKLKVRNWQVKKTSMQCATLFKERDIYMRRSKFLPERGVRGTYYCSPTGGGGVRGIFLANLQRKFKKFKIFQGKRLPNSPTRSAHAIESKKY